MAKQGEGSRGGKIVRHTKSGKAVYDSAGRSHVKAAAALAGVAGAAGVGAAILGRHSIGALKESLRGVAAMANNEGSIAVEHFGINYAKGLVTAKGAAILGGGAKFAGVAAAFEAKSAIDKGEKPGATIAKTAGAAVGGAAVTGGAYIGIKKIVKAVATHRALRAAGTKIVKFKVIN